LRDLELVDNVAKDLAMVCRTASLKDSLECQLEGIISALAKMIEKRDSYTEFHSQGVGYLTEHIAQKIGYPVSEELKIAALLHDIGKILCPHAFCTNLYLL